MDHIISHLFRAGTGPSTGLNHAPQAAQQPQKLSIFPNFFASTHRMNEIVRSSKGSRGGRTGR